MAVRYAVASGNWSSTATWDGGTLPTAADDVYADGKTVTIDQNVTVLSIRTSQRAGGTNGGQFQTSITCTINADIISNGGDGLVCNHLSGNTVTINGNLTGLNTSVNNANIIQHNNLGILNINGNIITNGGFQSYGIYNVSTATINIVGNLTHNGQIVIYNESGGTINITGVLTMANSSANSWGVVRNNANGIINFNGSYSINGGGTNYGIDNGSTGVVNINSSLNQPVGSAASCIINKSSGVININNDVLGAVSTSPSVTRFCDNSSTGVVNINGSVIMQSVSPSTTLGIIQNASTGTINVSGNVNGGTVANTIAINNGSTGTINVTGNIIGGSNATNTPAIYSTTAGTIDVTGSCSADAHPALWSTSTTAVNRLRGDVSTKNGIVAFYAFKVNISPSAAQQFTFQDTSNSNRILATSNISPGAPAASNVRFGTVYGSLGEYTGTLRVPNPNAVLLGNLTDNTTGTLLMTPSDFWNAATSGMTTSGSIGERLKNASTVQTTGDQLASYQV